METPLDRLKAKRKLCGAKESVATAQLKHRHPPSTAQMLLMGSLLLKEQRVYTFAIDYQARLGSQVYSPKTSGYPASLSKPLRPGKPGMTHQTFDKSI